MATTFTGTALYITGLPTGCTEEQLKSVFEQYGTVTSQKVLAPNPQKNDAAGIVAIESAEKAQWIVDNVSGTTPTGLTAPIDVKLKNTGWGGKGDDANDGTLYISGLPAGSDDEQVKNIFSQYGPVKSCKVLPARADKDGVVAVVSMVSPEQAKMLISTVSGTAPTGLSEPIKITAKLPGANSAKGWGKGFGFDMDPWTMMQMLYMKGSMMKGGGKGAYGKGFGKSFGSSGLSSFPASKKVWVGGLPEDVTFKELQEHFGGPGTAKFATVMKGKGAGTGGVAFGTPEEATDAVAKYNGTTLKGSAIVVDVWTKKEKGTETEAGGDTVTVSF